MKITFHDWNLDPVLLTLAPGDVVKGKVTFEAKESSRWISFGVEEAYCVSGKMRPKTEVVKTHILEGNKIMNIGERCTYDFVVTVVDAISYTGKYGSVQPQLIAFARPANPGKGFSGGLKGRDSWAQESINLTVKEQALKVREAPVSMTAQRTNGYMISLFTMLLLLTFLMPPPALIGWLVYATLYAYRSYVIHQLGEIILTPVNDAGGNWRAKVSTTEFGTGMTELVAWYQVAESVRERRGNNKTTHYRIMHKSPSDLRPADGTVYYFEHRLPVEALPRHSYGEWKISWKYCLIVKAGMGLTFNYETDLRIERAGLVLPALQPNLAPASAPKKKHA